MKLKKIKLNDSISTLSRTEMMQIKGGSGNPTCNKKSCYVIGTNKWACGSGGGYLAHCVKTGCSNCTHTTCTPY